MPGKKHGNVKDNDKNEALRDKGMGKERSAKTAGAAGAKQSGEQPQNGGRSKKA